MIKLIKKLTRNRLSHLGSGNLSGGYWATTHAWGQTRKISITGYRWRRSDWNKGLDAILRDSVGYYSVKNIFLNLSQKIDTKCNLTPLLNHLPCNWVKMVDGIIYWIMNHLMQRKGKSFHQWALVVSFYEIKCNNKTVTKNKILFIMGNYGAKNQK